MSVWDNSKTEGEKPSKQMWNRHVRMSQSEITVCCVQYDVLCLEITLSVARVGPHVFLHDAIPGGGGGCPRYRLGVPFITRVYHTLGGGLSHDTLMTERRGFE
jgi:hypothetical protein